MNPFAIEPKWVDVAVPDPPELRATYANLEIRVHEEVVTSVHHRSSRTTSDSVLVSLYPLTEWVVANWWVLTEESEVLGRSGFLERHAILNGRGGYCLPDLRFVSEGESFRLEWARYQFVHAALDFISAGSVRLPKDVVCDELRDFVDKVDERLRTADINDSWLQREWAAIREVEADQEQLRFCQAAAWLGLDPFDLSPEQSREIVDLADSLPDELREDALRATEVKELSAITIWIKKHLGLDASQYKIDGKLKQVAPKTPSARSEHPWAVGYELARRVRATVPALAGVPTPLENLFNGALPVTVAESAPETLDGLALFDGGFECHTAKSQPDSQRFLVARAVFDSMRLDQDKSLLTTARTTRQSEGRAFAAELLAPASFLQDRLRRGWTTPEQIVELAAELNVSEYVVEHQIDNHRIATISA